MANNSSEIDAEAYASDVIDAVTTSVIDSDHKFATEIKREVNSDINYTDSGITEIVKTGETITVELETPKASVTVELESDHPAIDGIEMEDYQGGCDEDGTQSITERLDLK